MEAFRNKSLMARLQVPASVPEGYVIEGTYSFTRPVAPEKIVTTLVGKSIEKIQTEIKEWRTRPAELGFTPYQIITLASLIEKEAPKPEDRPKVSAVYHNRLRIGLQLQSDEALRYGFPDLRNKSITQQDINQPGPYNTYLNVGIPPTPICSPSLVSIRAALFPVDQEYLYFTKKSDNSIVYASTYKKHQENIQKHGSMAK